MIRKIVLRPKAEADVDDIWTYTAEVWSETQAAVYLTSLDAAFRLLAEFPEMARLRQEFSPSVRIHPCREHLIVFVSDELTVDIVRVVHGRTNWSEFLAD